MAATPHATPFIQGNHPSGSSVDSRVHGINSQINDEFGETEAPHGEIVMIIARGVGFLVAIVAIVLSVLILMLLRALLAYIIHEYGVTVLIGSVMAILWAILKVFNIRLKLLWVMFNRSCC